MTEEKTCPACAEAVKEAAKVCKHCGHSFVDAAEPEAAPVDKPPASGAMKKGCLWVVGIFVVLVIIGSLLPDPPETSSNETVNAPQAIYQNVIVVSARELAQAYDANEARAQQQYGDSPLEVSGRVTGVSLDFMDEPFVQFAGLNPYQDVQASLVGKSRDRAGSLSKGQQLTVRCGSVSEVIGTPMLDDCEIVDE